MGTAQTSGKRWPPITAPRASLTPGLQFVQRKVPHDSRLMQVHLDVPEDVARQFATEPGGITRAVLEALAVEGVRSGKLTEYQARRMLGIQSRYEMDGFLKTHRVLLPIAFDDVIRESDTAAAFAK